MPYFFRKLGKMLQNSSSAAVVIGTLRVRPVLEKPELLRLFLDLWQQTRMIWMRQSGLSLTYFTFPRYYPIQTLYCLGLCHIVLCQRILHRTFVKSAYLKINFLISQSKHMLWLLKRTVSLLKLMGKKIFTILRSKMLFI